MAGRTLGGVMALSFLAGSANAATIGNWNQGSHSWNFGSYTTIKAEMEEADHSVEPDADITVENLANYDLFILGEARFLPSPEELTILSDWVQAGGVLLVMTDQGFPGAVPSNMILAALGSSISLQPPPPQAQPLRSVPLEAGIFASEGPPFDLLGQSVLAGSGNVVTGAHTLAGDVIHWEPIGNGYVFTFADRLDHNGFFNLGAEINRRLFLNIAGADILYVDTDAAGVEDGSSWCDAFSSLGDALLVVGPRTTIRVAEGTYHPDMTGLVDPREATFQLVNEVIIEGGFAGCGAADPDERDIIAFETILSGNLDDDDSDSDSDSENDSDSDDSDSDSDSGNDSDSGHHGHRAYHVVTGSGTDATAELSGFTVTQGKANDDSDNDSDSDSDEEFTPPHDRGAGMFNSAGSPTVRDCTFINNRARKGAGMMNQDGSAPKLVGCVFIGNKAHDGGGGIGNRDAGSDPTLINCLFTGNSAKKGGAMRSDHGAGPTLINCTISNNSANKEGSGVAHSGDGVTTLTNCILWGNDRHRGHCSNKHDGQHGHSGKDDGDESDQIHGPADSLAVDFTCIEGLVSGGAFDNGTNLGDDPLFVDANGADDRCGTDDDDLRLSQASPCIDTGDNAAVTVETDLDGNPRIVNDTVDMGAYEK